MKTFFLSFICIVLLAACEKSSPLSNREMGMDSKVAAPATIESQSGGSTQSSEGTVDKLKSDPKSSAMAPSIFQ
ncbi:MAG: hypothetical protein IPP15_22390 [Saprospiraceae bacterium]|uniref:Lipoprotein n=1 Tax=Candidatus Opimibacter skivensis TaxID=2982028 RepID=A0A9D7T005_9BACT|nr:hypothetical protein [Candidatus Opimibacter skivensis]